MKVFAPDYYKKFKCIGGECKHSCCIGWEIDIDADTLAAYNAQTGTIGKKLKDNIIISEDGSPCFKLEQYQRCPFLQKDGLCEIIIKLGEEMLCQICTDHPRFRNFFTNRTEIGLGLCCEAAATLILNNENKVTITKITNCETNDAIPDKEISFFSTREAIFQIVQNRSKPFKERIKELCLKADIIIPNISSQQWAAYLLTLEQLDSKWTEFLKSVCASDKLDCTVPDAKCEQLLCYFIYRHMNLENEKSGLRFALICTEILIGLSQYCDDFINLCRMFSSEIEYSEENIENLMDY